MRIGFRFSSRGNAIVPLHFRSSFWSAKIDCLHGNGASGPTYLCAEHTHLLTYLEARPDECKRTKMGLEYNGLETKTRSGLTCQRWDSQFPHRHRNTPQLKPKALLQENYCRNPDNEPLPWCYTTSPSQRWDFCDIPFCPEGKLHQFAWGGLHPAESARRVDFQAFGDVPPSRV